MHKIYIATLMIVGTIPNNPMERTDMAKNYHLTLIDQPEDGGITDRTVSEELDVQVDNVEQLADHILSLLGNIGEHPTDGWQDLLNSMICEKLGNRMASYKWLTFGKKIAQAVEVKVLK